MLNKNIKHTDKQKLNTKKLFEKFQKNGKNNNNNAIFIEKTL